MSVMGVDVVNQEVTVNNLRTISVEEMLGALASYYLEPIPEGVYGDVERLGMVEYHLGRLANIHSYIIHLWNHADVWTTRYKELEDKPRYADMIRKRDALERIARTVELKYKSTSRQLTIYIRDRDDLPESRDTNVGNGQR